MSYEFQFEDEITGLTYDCEAEISNTHDNNYGADADGRRGCAMDFPELESLSVTLDGVEVTDPLLLKRVEEYFDKEHWDKASQEAIDSYHEPDEEPDDDWED